ncbi:MAG: hypothetical protein ACREQY_01280, partial [Candidatus Binatia bacterium]
RTVDAALRRLQTLARMRPVKDRLTQEPPIRVVKLLKEHGLSAKAAHRVTADLLFAWDPERFSHERGSLLVPLLVPWSLDDVRRRVERPPRAP